MAEMQLIGATDFLRRLDSLDKRSRGAAKRNSLRAGASVQRRAYKDAAPRAKGKRKEGKTPLYKSIGSDVSAPGSSPIGEAFVGPRKNNAGLGIVLEVGSPDRYTKKGAYRGRVAATRWATRAHLKSVNKALEAIALRLEAELIKHGG